MTDRIYRVFAWSLLRTVTFALLSLVFESSCLLVWTGKSNIILLEWQSAFKHYAYVLFFPCLTRNFNLKGNCWPGFTVPNVFIVTSLEQPLRVKSISLEYMAHGWYLISRNLLSNITIGNRGKNESLIWSHAERKKNVFFLVSFVHFVIQKF
jgi:hypothetical protein